MKVKDVMVKDVKFCGLRTNLAAVTEVFWTERCGTLPVMDNGRVAAMITDRDICIALGTRNLKAGETLVKDVVLPKLFFSKPDDDIRVALKTMAAQKVRRLPVIDSEGALQGILSLDDIVLLAEANGSTLTYADVVETLKGICDRAESLKTLAVAN